MLDPTSIVWISPRVLAVHLIVDHQQLVLFGAHVSDVDELLVVVPIGVPTTIALRFCVAPFWSSLEGLHEPHVPLVPPFVCTRASQHDQASAHYAILVSSFQRSFQPKLEFSKFP